MAESRPSMRTSILIGSDQIPDHFCEPCYEASDNINPVAGFCNDCDVNLCLECFTSHRGLKIFKTHKLVDSATRPKTRSTHQSKLQNVVEECLVHQGERIHAYCLSHSEVICKVCLTIDHETCRTEKVSKLAKDIQDSQDLRNLKKKLSTLEKGFNDNQRKAGANELVTQRNHRDAINDMKKLRDEFDKLMVDTEKQADTVKAEDFAKLEKLSTTCDIVIKQINKTTTRLDTLKENNANESFFIAMKRAENQMQSLDEKLDKLTKDNAVREYTFESDEKLIAILNDLKVLGQLSFLLSQNVSKTIQKEKKPFRVRDVVDSTASNFSLWGSLVMPNKHILIAERQHKKLKIIDTDQNEIISEVQIAGQPFDVTRVKADEVVVTDNNPDTLQFFSVSQNTISQQKTLKADSNCRGIAFNDKDQSLVVTFINPPKIKILDIAGVEMKCIEHDSMGGNLFKNPYYVALTPDMTDMYVTDGGKESVILISLNGGVKAVYTDESLHKPYGLYVHKSGLVYVVCFGSHTVHELDPESGEFKVIMKYEDRLDEPLSISYCELKDTIYIGMARTNVMRVFQMK